MQQSLGRFLGVLDYDAHPHGLLEAVHCLLDAVKLSVNLNLLVSI
jgi:tubulin-specific chaperone D